jgi:hypothetical protein
MTARTRTSKLLHFPAPPEMRGQLAQVRADQAHLWGFTGALAVPVATQDAAASGGNAP